MDFNRALLLQAIKSRHFRAVLTDRGLSRLLPFARRNEAIDGQYDKVAGAWWMIYRHDGVLTLRIGAAAFAIDDATDIVLVDRGPARHLDVAREGITIASFPCPERGVPSSPALQPLTFFADDEDFDLPLLIANIARDRGRRARAYSSRPGPVTRETTGTRRS